MSTFQVHPRQLYQLYPLKFKLLITLCSYYLAVVYGMLYCLPSLALIDLTYLMRTDLVMSSYGMTARSVAYCIGSIAFGRLFETVDRRLCLIFGVFIASICLAALPLVNNVMIFLPVMFLMGLSSSTMDVAQNSWILDLWGDECGAYLQGLSAFFGIGALFAPLYTGPFLGLEPRASNASNVHDASHMMHLHIPIKEGKSLQSFYLVFMLTASSVLVAALVQIFALILENRKNAQLISKSGEHSSLTSADHSDSSESVSQGSKGNSRPVLIVGSLILCIIGAQSSSLNFVTELIVNLHPQDKDIVEKAALQVTIMNAAGAIFGILGIFVSRVVVSDWMVILDLVAIFIGCVMLEFAPQSFLFVTGGLFLFGAGSSTIYASIYAMLEERSSLTNMSVGLLMFASSTTSSLCPPLISPLMRTNPLILAHFNAVSTVIVFVCVIILILKVKRPVKL